MFPQLPELWLVLPPFLWSFLVCQRELTPTPALQEAEPIKAFAGLLAPRPGPSPLCSVSTHSDPLVYFCNGHCGEYQVMREHPGPEGDVTATRGGDSRTRDAAPITVRMCVV